MCMNHLGVRPIAGREVAWFTADSFEMEHQPLDAVLAEIKGVLKGDAEPGVSLGHWQPHGACGIVGRRVEAMQQTVIPEPPGFAELSKAEQVRYLQDLWDRIAERPGELPVPESHLELAEERLAEYRRDRSRARSAYEVIDRLAERAKKPR